jgi:hypothetical protein
LIDRSIRMETETTTEIWKHIESGEVYVVRVTYGGMKDRVIEACQPTGIEEVSACLTGGFDSDPDLVDELNANSDDYELYQP